MTEQTTQDAVAEIWKLFKETDVKFKETAARFKETDARFKETDARLDQRFKETDARLDKRSAETDRKLRQLEGLFSSQWGRLIEALVQPAALKLFRARGIDVHYTFPRAKSQQNGSTLEIDLLLEDGEIVVVVEVKSVLRVSDVQEFLEDLAAFPAYFPRYQGYQIYGAVAALSLDENADRYAYKQGLFVLSMSGEGMIEIRNDDKFHPQNFG